MFTKKFHKLPSDAGVTFTGFEKFPIKSREIVASKLSEFLNYCEVANKPAIRAITGEWGEGKTDAYWRYIKPTAEKKSYIPFFVSASTILNSLKTESVQKLITTSPLSAVQLLATIFYSIKHEAGEKNIPHISEYTDAKKYVDDVFERLCGKRKAKLIIFIDEFEELLTHPLYLKEIISGIKEIINGMYKPISENGKYEGCFHLVIATTPDAFYRLQIDRDISMIFGGLGRRTGVIDLPQISKKEAIKFLNDLLLYSYDEKLPDPLPFENIGIFHAMHRISLGNPGNMVSLFSRLLSFASEDDKVKIIDFNLFIKFLEGSTVFIYGGVTPCLEFDRFSRIMNIVKGGKLGEDCAVILKKLIGEPIPYSTEELEKVLKRTGKKVKIHNIISSINDLLKRYEQIERAILKVSKTKDGIEFDEILKSLEEFITEIGGKKCIKIDNFIETFENFRDKVSFFEWDNGSIKEYYILPIDEYSALSFFEGISLDRARELSYRFARKLCQGDPYYLVSEEMLRQVYPTPIPRELEFIKDREQRLELWREITRKLSSEFEKYMPDALYWLINESGLMSLIQEKRDRNFILSTFKYSGYKGRILLYSINGDVSGVDIEEIHRVIKQNKPIHCIFLIYTGEIDKKASEKIEEKRLGDRGENIFIEINLHPTHTKRIICCYKSQFMGGKEENIDQDILQQVIKRTIYEDLELERKFKEWISDQINKGVVVEEIKAERTVNPKDLAEALKFFINFIDSEENIEDIFNKNQDLIKFVKYKKVSLIPDIQLPTFSRLVQDLKNNNFLEERNGVYKVKKHPVENKILEIIKEKKSIDFQTLKKFFIVKNPKLLEDVFLHILEYKGLITKRGKIYSYKNVQELWEDIEDLLHNRFDRIFKDSNNLKFGFFVVSKERKYRFIKIKEYKRLIERIHRDANRFRGIHEEVELQKLTLLQKLLNHFIEEFYPLLRDAIRKSENEKIRVEIELNNIKEEFEHIKKLCKNILKIEFENIEEYEIIDKKYEFLTEVIDWKDKKISEFVSQVEKEKKKEFFKNNFYFGKNKEDAFYFNLKYFLIKKTADELINIILNYKARIEKIKGKFERVNREINEIKEEISKIKRKCDSNCKVSKSVANVLDSLSLDVLYDVETRKLKRVKLDEISYFITTNTDVILDNLELIRKCLRNLRDFLEEEKKFLNKFESIRAQKDILSAIFDTDYSKSYLTNIEHTINEVEKKYQDILVPSSINSDELISWISEKRSNIKKLGNKIEERIEEVIDFWNSYRRDLRNFQRQINKITDLFSYEYSIDFSKIEEDLNKIDELINVKNPIDLHISLSKIDKLRKSIGDKVYEMIRGVIKEKEYLVLKLLIKESQIKKWIHLEELYEKAKVELNMDEKEFYSVISKLIKHKLVRQGISLAV